MSAFDAGFALAALMTGDASAESALGAMAPALAARLRQRIASLGTAMAKDRDRALRHLALEAQATRIDGSQEARRVLALLATEVPKERGVVWLAAVPRHRPGFRSTPALRELMGRCAGPSAATRTAEQVAELDAVLGGEPWPG